MSRLDHWLCPTESERARHLDNREHVRKLRAGSLAALGAAAAIASPWLELWLFGLFVLGAAIVVFLHTVTIKQTARPERVSLISNIVPLVAIAVAVSATGGSTSPVLPWLVLPAAMIASRFRSQVVLAAMVLSALVIVAVTFGTDTARAAHDPVPVIGTLALLGSVVAIACAIQAAELFQRDEAVLDPLTGLLNRKALHPRFVELSQQARLTGQPVCLLVCDIDCFKDINDEHGHDRGDVVLRDLAYEMRKSLRSFELIYRLGGEEFLIVLPGIDRRRGEEIAEALRATVEHLYPTGIRTTISVGVSAGRGEQVDYETLFAMADIALYDAKRGGRNRVVGAPPPSVFVDRRKGAAAVPLGAEPHRLTPLAR